jgi:heat shock protein HslJ
VTRSIAARGRLGATTLLVLVLAATALLVAACSSSSDLTGKTWHLTAMTEKVPAFQGVVPAAEQANYTITFNTDGTFNAKADCNMVAGTYKTSGSSLTITLGPSTLAMCPEGSLDGLYVHALSRSSSYKIDGSTLTITLSDGGTLVFSSASVASPAAATPKAAATGAPAADANLTGKAWSLAAVTENVPAFQGVVPPSDLGKYTIQFSPDGTYSAKADCNMVAGTYTTTASGGMTINPGASTMAMCAEGSLSDLYVLGLMNTTSYAIAGDQLTLTLGDKGTLQFN